MEQLQQQLRQPACRDAVPLHQINRRQYQIHAAAGQPSPLTSTPNPPAVVDGPAVVPSTRTWWSVPPGVADGFAADVPTAPLAPPAAAAACISEVGEHAEQPKTLARQSVTADIVNGFVTN